MRKLLLTLITPLLVLGIIILVSQNAVVAVISELSSPERLLDALDVEILQASNQTKMIEVPKEYTEEIVEAFNDAGYRKIKADTVDNAVYQTQVFIKLNILVTMRETEESLMVSWGESSRSAINLLRPNDATNTGEVMMAQIGVARGEAIDNPMIGMCYVYVLSDGSAVIIDGGLSNDECAENIYRTLEQLKVARDDEGKIKISAWVFTHGHQDHIGAFLNFAEDYSESTSISYLMYSFPVGDVATKDCDVDFFVEHSTAYYPNAEHINPRAGLNYYFDNITLQILYAPEMIYEAGKTVEYYNDTSLIFIVECNGAKILHMGDAGEKAAKIAWESYREDAFLSDAVQITHHGLSTGADYTCDWEYIGYIYDATGAQIGLLPMGTRNTEEERNGRYSTLIQSAEYGQQLSFVMNENNRYGQDVITREFFDAFVEGAEDGTSILPSLFGYDGINTVVNEDGVTTYIASSNTREMVTLFLLGAYGVKMVGNGYLDEWFAL